MEQIQQITDEAINYLSSHHRHKTVSFADCTECQLRRYLAAIREESLKLESEESS